MSKRTPFARVPEPVLRARREGRITHADVTVYVGIAMWARKDGTSDVLMSQLEQSTGIARGKLSAHVGRLFEAELLAVSVTGRRNAYYMPELDSTPGD